MLPAYKDKNTFIFGLHPVIKVVLVISLLAASLFSSNPFLQVAVIIATAVIARSAGVFSEWLSWWRLCLFIALLALVINPLVSRAGVTVLWRGPRLPLVGRLDVTMEAIFYGAGMALRLAAMIWVFALLTLISDPDRLLGLLKGRGSRSALVSALTLKMVPTAMKDASDILDAQRARGLARDRGSKWEVLKSRLPLLQRLVSTSLDRAIGLAEAMESRGYGSGRRTSYFSYKLKGGDFAVASMSVLILAAVITGALNGAISFSYYPSLSWSASVAGIVIICLPVLVSLLILELSWSWSRWNWLKSRI